MHVTVASVEIDKNEQQINKSTNTRDVKVRKSVNAVWCITNGV